MTLIGMLHYRGHPSKLKKAYACAAIAKLEGHEFYYFSPGKVNLETETIMGWIFDSENWIKKEMSFPDVIYNAGGPKTEMQKKVYRTLKKKVPFTSFSVGTKMDVYKKIQSGKEFAHYLIPFKKIKAYSTIIHFLNCYQKVVIKPFSGSQGRDVIFLEKKGDLISLYDGGKEKLITVDSLRDYYENNIKNRKSLIQKFILCETKSKSSYDLRMHVQKNGEGRWIINRIYPRMAGNEKKTNNISGGGFRGELVSFLKNEFGDEYFNVKNYLEQFALKFTEHFESLYEKNFDELGLDVALDANRKIQIFEVNWRPGSKTRELDFARYLIPYAVYLANKSKI